jgi:tetrahydromethanopterin S-methyltransferase subunit G
MTEDDIARIDKQFDKLEETLRDGFARINIVLANQFGEVNNRVTALERKVDAGFAEVLEAIRSLKP